MMKRGYRYGPTISIVWGACEQPRQEAARRVAVEGKIAGLGEHQTGFPADRGGGSPPWKGPIISPPDR